MNNTTTPKEFWTPVHNTPEKSADHETGELRSPGLFRRLATLIYDGVLLICLEIVAALPLPAIPEEIRYSFPGRMAIFAGMLLVAYLFVGYCWTHGGQTLGERAWRVQVVPNGGGNMTWGLSLKRLILGIVSVLAGGFGLLWVLIDRNGHSWHDLLAGSRAQYYGKASKPAQKT